MPRFFNLRLVLITFLLTAVSTFGFGQFNTGFEYARTTSARAVDFTGYYSNSTFELNPDFLDLLATGIQSFGFRINLGLAGVTNVGVKYERLFLDGGFTEGVNYLAIVPKVPIIPNRLSVVAPVGGIFAFDDFNFTAVISPGLVAAFPSGSVFEINYGVKSDIFIPTEGDVQVLFGGKVGLGISTNLDNWGLRPEFGIQYAPGLDDILYNIGVSLSFALSRGLR